MADGGKALDVIHLEIEGTGDDPPDARNRPVASTTARCSPGHWAKQSVRSCRSLGTVRCLTRQLGAVKPAPTLNAEETRPMVTHRALPRMLSASTLFAGALLTWSACASRSGTMNQVQLTDLGTRYAAAWSSQNPARLASFYSDTGSLSVNAGPPSVGRSAIAATAQAFMTAFPDMVVKMDQIRQEDGHAVFRWTWTGTNSGPGGTGKFVRISGYEEWTLGADGLIAASKGHYDESEYQRQVKAGAPSQ